MPEGEGEVKVEAIAMKIEERKDEIPLLEEWTIIGDKESNVQQNNSGNKIESDIVEYETAEEVKETVKADLTTRIEEITDDKNRTDCLVSRDEDSDGISVIAESEKGDESHCKHLSYNKIKNSIESIYPSAEALIHIIVACSLAAAVGFGIGFFVSPRNTQLSPTSDFNFGKKSHDFVKFVDQSNSKNDIVNLIDTIVNDVTVDSPPVNDDNVKNSNINADSNLNSIPSLKKILDKIQYSLDILCILINDMQSLKNSKNNICNQNIPFFDVIKLKNDVQSIIYETGFTEEISNKRFIENMDLKIRNISLTFFSELPTTVKSSMVKIDRKLNKVRRKLFEKLCLLQNTLGDDMKFQVILKKRNLSLEKCDKITQEYNRNKQEQKRPKHPVGPEKENQEEKELEYERKKKDLWKMKIYKNEKKSKKRYVKNNDDNFFDSQSDEKEKLREYGKGKNSKYSNGEGGKFCEGKLCKQRTDDRKNSEEIKEDWQFKRFEGRNKWRIKNGGNNNDDNFSWEYDRAKGRERARRQFEF